MSRCDACGAALSTDSLVCEACGMLTPFHEKEAFSFLGLSASFDISLSDLEKAYIQKQRLFHPDLLRLRAEKNTARGVEWTSFLNTVYQNLKKPFTRGELLLKKRGETLVPFDARTHFSLLEEVLAWQEKIAAAPNKSLLQEYERKLSEKEADVLKRTAALFQEEAGYEAISFALYELRYMGKLQEDLRLKMRGIQ